MGKLHPFPVCILRRQPVNKILKLCVFTTNRLDYKYRNNLCQAYPAKECQVSFFRTDYFVITGAVISINVDFIGFY